MQCSKKSTENVSDILLTLHLSAALERKENDDTTTKKKSKSDFYESNEHMRQIFLLPLGQFSSFPFSSYAAECGKVSLLTGKCLRVCICEKSRASHFERDTITTHEKEKHEKKIVSTGHKPDDVLVITGDEQEMCELLR